MTPQDFNFNNTGYTVTTVYQLPNGHIRIDHRSKTGKEMLADWGYADGKKPRQVRGGD